MDSERSSSAAGFEPGVITATGPSYARRYAGTSPARTSEDFPLPDAPTPRFNERLDHLQAEHPFRYNLVTGALIGLVLALFGFSWAAVALYTVSWAAVRAFLWRDGRILRRQYEVRQLRVAERQAERRRRH